MNEDEKRRPGSVERAFQERLADPATARAIQAALAAASAERPYAAEPDRDRRVRRIEALSGAPREIAEAVADGDGGADDRAAIEEARHSARARATGTIPARALGAGIAAVTAVARLRPPGRTGTALLLSHSLLLATADLLPDRATAAATRVDLDAIAPAAPRARLVPDRWFHCEPDPAFDFALVAIELPTGAEAAIRPCPLGALAGRHAIGDPLILVQHPPGRPPELVFRETRVLHRTPSLLLYSGEPGQGCEGAPLFNDDWELVAMHHARGERPGPGSAVPCRVNEAVRSSAIAARLAEGMPALPPAIRGAVEAILAP
jgi:endonuclease G